MYDLNKLRVRGAALFWVGITIFVGQFLVSFYYPSFDFVAVSIISWTIGMVGGLLVVVSILIGLFK